MYFSIGAHEAYACDGGIENYSLVFDTCESFETLLLNDGFLNHKVQKITDDSCKLPLKYSYMKFDSNLKSKTVKLKNNITGDTVAIDFSDFKICFYGQFQTPNIYVSNHGTVFPIMLTVITI